MKKIAVVTALASLAGVLLVSCGNTEAPPVVQDVIVHKYEINGNTVVEWNTKISNDRCVAIKHSYGYSISCIRE